MTTPAHPTLTAMLASLRGYWSDARPVQRVAYVGGAVLIGRLAHGLMRLIVGGSLDGPLSWRKPTTFGVSFGLTAITLAWVAQFLALSERALKATVGLVLVTTSIEVAWVSVQHARGVASHFNESTPLDYALFLTAGSAVTIAVGVIAYYLVRSFTSSTAPAAMTLALRRGCSSCWYRWRRLWMICAAPSWTWNRPPSAWAAASSWCTRSQDVRHPGPAAVAWIASFAALAERRRLGLVALAALGYALLLADVGCWPGRVPRWLRRRGRSGARRRGRRMPTGGRGLGAGQRADAPAGSGSGSGSGRGRGKR